MFYRSSHHTIGANVYITHLYYYTARRRVIYTTMDNNIILLLFICTNFFFFSSNSSSILLSRVRSCVRTHHNKSNIILSSSFLSSVCANPMAEFWSEHGEEGNRSTRRLPKRIKIVVSIIIMIFCPSSRVVDSRVLLLVFARCYYYIRYMYIYIYVLFSSEKRRCTHTTLYCTQ